MTKTTPWRPPTRRAFVAMIGAAAAALAFDNKVKADPSRKPAVRQLGPEAVAQLPRWIGHC